MNKIEAKQIVYKELEAYRALPYSELIKMIGAKPTVLELTAMSKVRYQIEIQAFWDDEPGGNVRVMGSIDDGGWRAFVPLSLSFIKNSDDRFVGE